ncbi:unnamed protein product [Zymoseptoria tritici ST99CH_3D7]|uniref:Zn(2)-C6 fungal-type domain-containing protein n=1 Tax=Zymoseptoria tritici (strain ST99CH_3D7) TaxID=1276538 RepID=A0A1X7RK39_ZYMT9|nr:unnamed protein product [Zymoseptoria tritici ST99CH_3D7]
MLRPSLGILLDRFRTRAIFASYGFLAMLSSEQRRSRKGCWTCRLRRKKCDEGHPACSNCESLLISCGGYGPRPDYMDRGPREREAAKKLKLDIAQREQRRGKRRQENSGNPFSLCIDAHLTTNPSLCSVQDDQQPFRLGSQDKEPNNSELTEPGPWNGCSTMVTTEPTTDSGMDSNDRSTTTESALLPDTGTLDTGMLDLSFDWFGMAMSPSDAMLDQAGAPQDELLMSMPLHAIDVTNLTEPGLSNTLDDGDLPTERRILHVHFASCYIRATPWQMESAQRRFMSICIKDSDTSSIDTWGKT